MDFRTITRSEMWTIYLAVLHAVDKSGGEIKLGKGACGGTIIDLALKELKNK